MSDYLVTPSITKKQDEKPNLTQSHHTNTHSDSLPAPTPHLATNPTSNHVDTSHTYHIPYQSSLEDGFMFPHEDIYIKNEHNAILGYVNNVLCFKCNFKNI